MAKKRSSKQIWKEIEAAEKAGIRRLFYKHLFNDLYKARMREAHAFSDSKYFIVIRCPEATSVGGHKAKLFVVPHKYAGQYECNYNHNDVHEHTDYEVVEDEVPSSNPDSSDYYIRRYYICGQCGVAIPSDVADPDRDKAEGADYE